MFVADCPLLFAFGVLALICYELVGFNFGVAMAGGEETEY